MRSVVAKAVSIIGVGFCASVAASQVNPSTGFMQFPIDPKLCAGPKCAYTYKDGPYTVDAINSVLDHAMAAVKGGFAQYKTDGAVIGFNGEEARGARKSNDPKSPDFTCIKGKVELRPAPGKPPMVNTRSCGAGYANYDGHPGYDYYAPYGTPVYAAASGTVLSIGGAPCYDSNLPKGCSAWGFLGIDHGNGYISQYGHLSSLKVSAGQKNIKRGQLIGYSGNKAPPGYSLGAHLHFEVLKLVKGEYLVVDPYGWVGAGKDPLYSRDKAPPAKLWQ